MPAFSGCAPRLQRMIPMLEPRKGGKCIPKSASLRPRGAMWEAGQGSTMGRGSAQPWVLNHLTAKPQNTVMAPNQCDCNQLEASCIQQRRLKHAICKMHVKINNNNNSRGGGQSGNMREVTHAAFRLVDCLWQKVGTGARGLCDPRTWGKDWRQKQSPGAQPRPTSVHQSVSFNTNSPSCFLI